jgi:hypothetical protein
MQHCPPASRVACAPLGGWAPHHLPYEMAAFAKALWLLWRVRFAGQEVPFPSAVPFPPLIVCAVALAGGKPSPAARRLAKPPRQLRGSGGPSRLPRCQTAIKGNSGPYLFILDLQTTNYRASTRFMPSAARFDTHWPSNLHSRDASPRHARPVSRAGPLRALRLSASLHVAPAPLHRRATAQLPPPPHCTKSSPAPALGFTAQRRLPLHVTIPRGRGRPRTAAALRWWHQLTCRRGRVGHVREPVGSPANPRMHPPSRAGLRAETCPHQQRKPAGTNLTP